MPANHDSNRAVKIRARLKAKLRVSPADLAWLDVYERTRANDGNGGRPPNRAAQRSRKVSYTEEESQAVAEGNAASELAAAAIMTRAEGERLDSILKIGVHALRDAVEAYKSMCASLLEERQADAQTHRALLESLRTHFLERTEAEAALIRSEAEAEAAQAQQASGQSAIESAVVEVLAKRLAGGGGNGGDEPPIGNSESRKRA